MSRRVRRQEGSGTPAVSPLRQREILFVRLVVETAKWLDMVEAGPHPLIKQQRGVVRGMALSITKMWGNGYEPHWTQEIKDCEAAGLAVAKKWIGKGRPEKDKFWIKRRHLFWRSSVDQRGARR